MTPEMMNCLIGCLALLAGYFTRHMNIALPGISIPTPQQTPAPVVVQPTPALSQQPVSNFDPIVQQLLAHQMALIQQLKNPGANGMSVAVPTPAPASAS